jgi:RNA polymerase sigma factor (sigma-70 family)
VKPSLEPNTDYEYLRYITETTDKRTILKDLMNEFGNDVWNYAYSLTHKWEQADDITQDVFLKAYRHLHTFRCESSIKTWLLAITRNTVKDLKKSAFFRKVTLVDLIPSRDVHPSAESEVIENNAVSDIWKKVLLLPVKYREVLILYGHYQLSMKEIAEMLDVSIGTVKSRLHHARMKVIHIKEVEEHGAHR